ncbi:MAG: class I SAM-dependent methyltransferase [Microthrixaceae bacterium]
MKGGSGGAGRTVDKYADDWEANARRDPRFAILSDPAHNDGGWDDENDAFMASGVREIDAVFAHLDEHSLAPVRRRRALDFGCGLGRLSNALGSRFDAVVGVDISATMVEKATALAVGPHVTFVVNQADDLGQFDDSSFDFVYTNIVLQHVDNDLQRGYLAEFCRVLAPGGLAVVQLPSLRRGWKGTVRRILPDAATTLVRRFGRPEGTLRREGYTIRMEMNCLPESEVWAIVEARSAVVAHTTYTNAAEPDFNGRPVFMDSVGAWQRAAGGGYVSPVYVIRRRLDP